MKVICKEEKLDERLFTIGKEYLVMEIYFTESDGLIYRIICDDSTAPTLVNAEQFDILDGKTYSKWVVKYDNKALRIGPEKWLNDTLWQYSFWEDYFSDDDEKARQVFEEELEKMIAESEL